ncbi:MULTISPECIES: proline iminopeptidase-family hydrolase [Dyadobacter]|uniref:Alpha/beta fold hydrolase n=1 Tax=Dyadobacter psychrotolerans TaxID=2541721 RepID=A0A4V2Z3M5_9BACT|nr:proline iminopeptidase-family hydrolase [Dyadobacter psychrotolerans]TDE13218.1 alpha/beta fold hydrolase [Dyadobacter psychrotolerans]
MKNLSTFAWSFIFIGSMTVFSCRSNIEMYDLRSASKMRNYLSDTSNKVRTGGVRIIPISTPKGNFKVWTKTVGHNEQIKVLLLGSGPGLSHEYLQCIESYFPEKAISFIYYDPLGSGSSDNPNDTTLWNLARYTDEIEQVRSALNLNQDNFYLFGHGWGGVLAMEYALKHQNNLKALILSNIVSSSKVYNSYARQLTSNRLPVQTTGKVDQKEAKPNNGNSKDQAQLTEFNSKHVCRIPPDQLQGPVKSFFNIQNDSINIFLGGPGSVQISRQLANWDRSADLARITVPTLTVGAKYDFMDPQHIKWMASQIQNGTFLYCANGSHLSMYDDQQAYMTGITDFIYKVYRKEHWEDIYF